MELGSPSSSIVTLSPGSMVSSIPSEVALHPTSSLRCSGAICASSEPEEEVTSTTAGSNCRLTVPGTSHDACFESVAVIVLPSSSTATSLPDRPWWCHSPHVVSQTSCCSSHEITSLSSRSLRSSILPLHQMLTSECSSADSSRSVSATPCSRLPPFLYIAVSPSGAWDWRSPIISNPASTSAAAVEGSTSSPRIPKEIGWEPQREALARPIK